MNRKIVWLASYPKSGNTWLRIFLSNFLFSERDQIDINDIPINNVSYSRLQFEEMLDIDTELFSVEEEENLRPMAFKSYAQTLDRLEFIKVHEAQYNNSKGEAIFPSEVSRGVIYIVRNPLDVAVSFSNHLQIDIDSTIKYMSDSFYDLSKINKGDLRSQLSIKLKTWSENVESWIDQKEIPIHVVRYEDMMSLPLKTFGAVLKFLNFAFTKEELVKAINKSSFNTLQQMEKDEGFREHKNTDVEFFRSGNIGDWKLHLSEDQRDRILADHSNIMRRLGYLDD